MTAAEREFEQRLNAVGQDSRACAVFVYTELAFHHLAGNDANLRDVVNDDAAFWNGVLGGVQAAAFVALGRIYDRGRRVNSAEQLLRFASGNVSVFSRTALEARKIATGALPAAEALAYAAAAFQPQAGDLEALDAAFRVQQRFYQDKVKPIRDEVFAHSGRLTTADRDALFTQLFVRPFEELAVFPLRLWEALWQLYHNGAEPMLSNTPTIIGNVLNAAPAPNINTWEHLHVGGHTAAFLQRLKMLKGDED